MKLNSYEPTKVERLKSKPLFSQRSSGQKYELLKIFSKNHILLALVFILVATTIILRAYLSMDSYLSGDSKAYLNLAQSILDGNGPYTLQGQTKTYFSIWPLGYPLLIAITSMTFQTTVYWGSKTLNIIFILFIIILLKKMFKQHAYNYAFPLLWASYLSIFSYTWSEAAFIFGILWFSYSICQLHNNDTNITRTANVIFSSIFLFLIRYVGAFSILATIILTIYYIITDKAKHTSALLITIFIQTTMIVSYLYINFYKTGYITGMPRPGSVEGNLDFLMSLLVAIFFEFNILLAEFTSKFELSGSLIIQFIIMLLLSLALNKSIKHNRYNIDSPSLTCLFIGTVYLSCIIYLRWLKDFDDLGYRFLAPGTFLLIMAMITYMRSKYDEYGFQFFSNCLISLSLISYIFNVPLKLILLIKF
jgi:hypothetical protein